VADREAARLVHPRVDRDHRHGAENAAERDRDARPPVRPATQPAPAVQVDRGEDGLEKEEQALDTEGQAEDCPVLAHQPRPEQAHLEGEHRAGHRADRDQHPHDLGPAPRQCQRDRIRSLQPDELGEEHCRRQRNPQARQDDVKAQRRCHLRTSGYDVAADAHRAGNRHGSNPHGRLRTDRNIWYLDAQESGKA
jgi:hypothetical protein